jgi:hypothetical protein
MFFFVRQYGVKFTARDLDLINAQMLTNVLRKNEPLFCVLFFFPIFKIAEVISVLFGKVLGFEMVGPRDRCKRNRLGISLFLLKKH